MGAIAVLELIDRDGQARQSVAVRRWPLRVGRSLDNHMVLADPHVAAHHFVVESTDEGLRLTVGETGNGVQIGRLRLHAGELHRWPADGEPLELTAGRTRLRLRTSAQALPAELPLAGLATRSRRFVPSLVAGSALLAALMFNTYLDTATDTTRKMILNVRGADLTVALGTMQAQYRQVRDTLAANTQRDQKNLVDAFEAARQAQSSASLLIVAIIILCLAALVGVSMSVTRALVGPVGKAVQAAHRLRDGDVTVRFETTSTDEVGQLVKALSDVTHYLQEMADIAQQIALGDLRRSPKPRSAEDRFGHAFGEMTRRLAVVSRDLKIQASGMAAAARQVSSAASDLSAGTSDVAASVEETLSSLEQMRASIAANAGNSIQIRIWPAEPPATRPRAVDRSKAQSRRCGGSSSKSRSLRRSHSRPTSSP